MADRTSTNSALQPPQSASQPPESASQPPPLLIPNLPDDVTLQCIARVPRSQHPSLSLVSKSWRSTIRSPHLFTTRSHLNCTEKSLYLNIRNKSEFNWYQFHPIPKPKINPKPLPPIPSQPIGPAFAVLGPKIYVIGGSINDIPSNNVWVFDCRINQWEIGPRMRVGREFAAAETADGKIYVMGGCLVDNWARSINWAEVLDPVAGSWQTLPSAIEVKEKWMHSSAVMNGKIYAMADRGGVVYDVASGGGWGNVPKRLDLGWRGRGAVVDGVLYSYDYLGKIRGYVVEEDVWKELRGVKRLPKFLCGATMMNLNGRLCVVWEQNLVGKEMEIMCAEIEVSRDGIGGGLSGLVLWSGGILSVLAGSSIVHCLAVAL